MKKSVITTAAIILLLQSCGKNAESGSVSVFESGNSDKSALLNVQMDQFVPVDSSGVLMFPMQMGQRTDESGNSYYKETPESSYWNIVFLNTQTGEHHLLTEEKIILDSYYLSENEQVGEEDRKKSYRHIFYVGRNVDFNRDKMITGKDPVALFVSDREGRNFRKISPQNASLRNWQYFPESSRVVMVASADSDKNSQFDLNDEISSYEVILNQNETPKPLFDQAFRQKLKTLYDRDWKKIK